MISLPIQYCVISKEAFSVSPLDTFCLPMVNCACYVVPFNGFWLIKKLYTCISRTKCRWIGKMVNHMKFNCDVLNGISAVLYVLNKWNVMTEMVVTESDVDRWSIMLSFTTCKWIQLASPAQELNCIWEYWQSIMTNIHSGSVESTNKRNNTKKTIKKNSNVTINSIRSSVLKSYCVCGDRQWTRKRRSRQTLCL